MHAPDGKDNFSSLAQFFLSFISSYGWIIVLVLTTYFLLRDRVSLWWRNFRLSPVVLGETQRREQEYENCEKEKRLASIRKMQETQDALARVHTEKTKQEEEERRRKRLEELEGKIPSGHRLGTTSSPANREADAVIAASKILRRKGPSLRQDTYNPLGGSGGGGGGFKSSRSCGPKGG